ncbi:hypothetical protein XaraCFBP7407_03915 [Xanthomonas arboricola pv. arracaciae]|nr:hypothetical protein XaraCFBP7407_03915 [Xanthomonas arboricola pv. arracaciae]
MRRVPRWWAGKGPAAKLQINRSTTDLCAIYARDHSSISAYEGRRDVQTTRQRRVPSRVAAGTDLIAWRD